MEKVAGGNGLFIGEHGGEGDAGVVVNGDIEKLPASSASFVLRVAGHTMSGFVNAGQFFNVDMQQVSKARHVHSARREPWVAAYAFG